MNKLLPAFCLTLFFSFLFSIGSISAQCVTETAPLNNGRLGVNKNLNCTPCASTANGPGAIYCGIISIPAANLPGGGPCVSSLELITANGNTGNVYSGIVTGSCPNTPNTSNIPNNTSLGSFPVVNGLFTITVCGANSGLSQSEFIVANTTCANAGPDDVDVTSTATGCVTTRTTALKCDGTVCGTENITITCANALPSELETVITTNGCISTITTRLKCDPTVICSTTTQDD